MCATKNLTLNSITDKSSDCGCGGGCGGDASANRESQCTMVKDATMQVVDKLKPLANVIDKTKIKVRNENFQKMNFGSYYRSFICNFKIIIMEPFLPSKWSNSVGPSYCIADTEGNCIDVIPVVVTPPVVNPAPGEVIVTPVPTTGIINADAPITTSPTITQTTTTPTAPAAPTLVNPNAHLNEPDPILQSAIVGIQLLQLHQLHLHYPTGSQICLDLQMQPVRVAK